MMSQRLADTLAALAIAVLQQWADVKLRVPETGATGPAGSRLVDG